jgi:acylglycerol lipase
MIAMPTVLSTTPRMYLIPMLLALTLAACAAETMPPGPPIEPPHLETDAFVMPDGARLPYRAWLPEREEPPWAVILALHGMNDSRDAWEDPAPAFTDAGIAVFAPDQRGFGATADRGHWPGAQTLADDATAMTRLLRARYPRAKMILLGESMGAAVLMTAATGKDPPPADGYVLVAPAVWGRAQMNFLLRGTLWLASNLAPGLTLTGRAAGRVASDNRDALIRLTRNPLTIKDTRIEVLSGVANLMDTAQAAAPKFQAPALFLYGGKDEIIPRTAMRATWAALPTSASTRRAFYPSGYHLLLRDLGRALPTTDILTWIRRPTSPLASEAEARATSFVAASPRTLPPAPE